MSITGMAKKFSKEELEKLLSSTLVPVEPSDQFVNRLRASLVKIHGRKPFTIWTGLALLGSILLLLAMTLGVVLRFVLAGVGIVNLLISRQSYRKAARGSARV